MPGESAWPVWEAERRVNVVDGSRPPEFLLLPPALDTILSEKSEGETAGPANPICGGTRRGDKGRSGTLQDHRWLGRREKEKFG
jgi:hypothetical protein